VIDGFPRSIDQASYFDEIVSSRSIVADVVLTSLDFRPLFYNFVRLLRVGDDRTIDCQS